jgi:hypothetical protein
MLDHLKHWARRNPSLVSMPRNAARDSATGKALPLVVFTASASGDEEGGDNNTNNNTNSTSGILPRNQRARALITCGIHARELITVDACFALLRLLASPHDDDAMALLAWPEMRASLRAAGIISASAAASQARALPAVRAAARRLASQTELRVIPVVNPDGRAAIESQGSYGLRVNARGVDLNRNLQTNWLPPAAGQQPGDDTYPGLTPASEWETRALGAALVGGGKGEEEGGLVDSFVDLHSGFVSLMGPSASSACGLQRSMTRESARMHERAMRAMQRSMPSPTVAGPTARVLYGAAGTTLDDAFVRAKANVAVAVEVYDAEYSSRLGFRCPTYQAFWDAPCRSEHGYGAAAAAVRCEAIRSAAGGDSKEVAPPAPRVPDGELMWHELKGGDDAKLAELMARHGVSERAVGAARRAMMMGEEEEEEEGGGAGSTRDDSEEKDDEEEQQGLALVGAGGNGDGDSQRQPQPEAWWQEDVILKHAAAGGAGGSSWFYLTTFNPTTADEFRSVISAWVAALWSYARDAERRR